MGSDNKHSKTLQSMTPKEIVFQNYDLIRTCIDCQFAKLKDQGKMQYKEDLLGDIILELCDYGDKLVDAYEHKHLNALITKIIINNIYSSTSRFYNKYLKFQGKTEELTYDDDLYNDYN